MTTFIRAILALALGAVLCSLIGTSPAMAGELTPAARLRKMSLRIRGTAPSELEFAQLQSTPAKNQPAFFEAKAQEYVSSPWADLKLTERLMENFRLNLELQDVRTQEGSDKIGDLPSRNNDRYIGRTAKSLRMAIESGLSIDEIFGSTRIHDMIRADAAFQSVRSVVENGRWLMNGFRRGASSKGYDMKTSKGVRAAIADFDKNPETFTGVIQRRTDVQVYTELLGIYPDGAPGSMEQDWQNLLKDFAAGKKVGKWKNNDFTSVQILDYLSRFYIDVKQDGGGYAWIPDGQLQGSRGINIDAEKMKRMACALAGRKGPDTGRRLEAVCRGMDAHFQTRLASGDLLVNVMLGMFDDPKRVDEAKDYAAKYSNPILEKVGNSMSQNPNAPTILTLLDMQQKYQGTKYSRAAALFRIYLCDEMNLVAKVDKATRFQKSMENFLTATSSPAEVRSSKTVDDGHVKGTCIACHRKLDPARSLLESLGLARNNYENRPQPSRKTTFVYDDAEGTELRIPVKSIADFVPTLVAQPQFVRCQSEKFWKWIIGEDVELDQKRREDLIAKYQNLRGDPRKLISYLVLRPEFSTDDTFTEKAGFSSAQSTLQHCNSCHSSEGTIPSFTKLPISFVGTTAAEKHKDHVGYLTDIAAKLDLAGDGSMAKMPPKDSNWKISQSERRSLTAWLRAGAPDERGQPTLTAAERDKLFSSFSKEKIVQIETSRGPVATFRPTWKRYFENYDLAKVLSQKLSADVNCIYEFERQRSAAGSKDIKNGLPSSDRPTGAFRQFYEGCVTGALQRMEERLGDPRERDTLTAAFGLKSLASGKVAYGRDEGLNVSWQNLKPVQQTQIIDDIIRYYIGAGVLSSDKLEKLRRQALTAIEIYSKNRTTNVVEASQVAVYSVLNDDLFLTH